MVRRNIQQYADPGPEPQGPRATPRGAGWHWCRGPGRGSLDREPHPEHPVNRPEAVFLRLDPSPSLMAVLIVAYAGAAVCLLVTPLPPGIRWMLMLVVTGAGAGAVLDHGMRRSDRSILFVGWDRHGQWRLARRDGRILEGTLLDGGFSHPLLIVLRFRCHTGRHIPLVIVPDMVDGHMFRRLRVRLRCTTRDRRTGAVC